MKALTINVYRFINNISINNNLFTFLLVSIFFILSFLGILNHEMWRDELQAWMIARDSLSLIDLHANLRYERHPGLWHTCLYVITRFTHNPFAMQLFHLLLSTATIYVFIKFSPFTRLQKFLFTFGYFPFYEYNLIARNYSIGVLLILLFCYFFNKKIKNYVIICTLLSLLANTNVYALIIASCLFGLLIVDKVDEFKNNQRLVIPKKVNLCFSLIIVILGFINALIQIIPPADMPFRGHEIVLHKVEMIVPNLQRLYLAVKTIWRGYIPIPKLMIFHFWDTNIMEVPGITQIYILILSLFLLFFAIAMFMQKTFILWLYLSGTMGIFLFTYLKFIGYTRHHGHLFIWLVVCLWLEQFYNQTVLLKGIWRKIATLGNKYKKLYINAILCIHFAVGIFTYTMDLNYPFSASKQVADFISDKNLNNTVIAGSRDALVAPVGALLEQKIYYPEINNFGSFINWKTRRNVDHKDVLDKINKIFVDHKSPILLILSFSLKSTRPDLNVQELAKFPPGIVEVEAYYLYSIKKI